MASRRHAQDRRRHSEIADVAGSPNRSTRTLPTTGFSPAVTFQISSLLLVIAVIAVCLGIAHENIILGIILAVVVVPALVYTVVVAEKRSAGGSPMAVLDKAATFARRDRRRCDHRVLRPGRFLHDLLPHRRDRLRCQQRRRCGSRARRSAASQASRPVGL